MRKLRFDDVFDQTRVGATKKMEDIVGDKNFKSVIMKSPESSPPKIKPKKIRKGDSQRSIDNVEPSPRGIS